mgnify:CR=1 FL=1
MLAFMIPCMVVVCALRVYRRCSLDTFVLDFSEVGVLFVALFLLHNTYMSVVVSTVVIFTAVRVSQLVWDHSRRLVRAGNWTLVVLYVWMYIVFVQLSHHTSALLVDGVCVYRVLDAIWNTMSSRSEVTPTARTPLHAI